MGEVNERENGKGFVCANRGPGQFSMVLETDSKIKSCDFAFRSSKSKRTMAYADKIYSCP
jgi:hypothetical protein